MFIVADTDLSVAIRVSNGNPRPENSACFDLVAREVPSMVGPNMATATQQRTRASPISIFKEPKVASAAAAAYLLIDRFRPV